MDDADEEEASGTDVEKTKIERREREAKTRWWDKAVDGCAVM
jgi:hypothetical protein